MAQRKPDQMYLKMQQEAQALSKFSGIPEEECHLLLYPDQEHYTVAVIKKYLRTPEQKTWLDAHDYSIEDLLNGRTTGDDETMVHAIFEVWNAMLGRKMFGS